MTVIDHYAPLPTRGELARLSAQMPDGARWTHQRRIEGGLGCTMDVLASEDSPMSRVVLRRYGPWGNPSDDHPAPVEAHALELAGKHGVPVPDVLWVDHDGVFKEPAVVISYIDGVPLTRPDDPIDWAEQLARAAAAIHAVPLEEPDYSIIEVARPGRNDDGKTVPEAMASHELGEALWQTILSRRAGLVGEEDCFLHADFWPGNTLWSEGRLLAVVDWEHPMIGDPALDIAYAASDMRYVGMDEAADHFISSYREQTGRSLPNLDYWAAISWARPMPDIARWHPSFIAFGHEMTVDDLRARHAALIQEELA